jgi:hypothetical protein
LSMTDLIRPILPLAFSSLVAVAVIAPFEHSLMHSDQKSTVSGFTVLTLETLGYILIYLGALRIVDPVLITDVMRAIRRATGRVRDNSSPQVRPSPDEEDAASRAHHQDEQGGARQ